MVTFSGLNYRTCPSEINKHGKLWELVLTWCGEIVPALNHISLIYIRVLIFPIISQVYLFYLWIKDPNLSVSWRLPWCQRLFNCFCLILGPVITKKMILPQYNIKSPSENNQAPIFYVSMYHSCLFSIHTMPCIKGTLPPRIKNLPLLLRLLYLFVRLFVNWI